MAEKGVSTAPRYRLRTDLRVPSKGDQHFRWIPAGEEADADELEGLALPALEQGGFLEKIAEAQLVCEHCQAHGNQKEKKQRYAPADLTAHYQEEHPGLVPPEEA